MAGILSEFAGADLLLEEVRRLAVIVPDLRERTRRVSEGGVLWNRLHGTIEQHIALAAAGLTALEPRFEELISSLSKSPADLVGDAANDLQSSLKQCARPATTVQAFEELSSLLKGTLARLETVVRTPDARSKEYDGPTRDFHIIAVEDDPLWRDFIRGAIDTVRKQLGPQYEVACSMSETVAETERLFDKAATPSGSGRRHQLVAIIDMGLPFQPGEAPNRENGHKLLSKLRSFRQNVPVIILTTPPYLLEDQLRVCELGIPASEYILKGPEKRDELALAVRRVVEISRRHTIEVRDQTQPVLLIDRVPVELEEMPFRTFCALASLSECSRTEVYSTARYPDELDEIFRDAYDYRRPPETDLERAQVLARKQSGSWWSASETIDIANVIRLWAASKVETHEFWHKRLPFFGVTMSSGEKPLSCSVDFSIPIRMQRRTLHWTS